MCSISKDIYDLGGSHLLNSKYNGSLQLLITSVYPQHNWLPWRFVNVPHKFWDDKNNQQKFMEWAGKQLNIKEMSDWYKVTQKVEISWKFR